MHQTLRASIPGRAAVRAPHIPERGSLALKSIGCAAVEAFQSRATYSRGGVPTMNFITPQNIRVLRSPVRCIYDELAAAHYLSPLPFQVDSSTCICNMIWLFLG